ncbi:MAG: hypothetical protein ACYDH9_11685 [Limisphaerales bacterium]
MKQEWLGKVVDREDLSGNKRLVFAPTKYLDGLHLEEHPIEFCQLPFDIYKTVKPKKA